MNPLKKNLKIRLLLLSLIFPFSFSFLGFFMGHFMYPGQTKIYLSIGGFVFGIFLDFICYYRKLFTITLFQTPIPLTLFLLVVWISNSFVKDLFAFIFGLGGLIIGLWLNNELVLPFQFYRIRKRILAILYLFFSIVLLGIFRGIPAFNMLLGVLAGNYLSIRVISNFREEREINKNLKQGSAFTSFILLIITVISGFIALSDIDNSIMIAQQILGISLNKTLFTILISVGGIIIVLLQYFITLITARTMLQLWKHKRFSRYLPS